MDTWRFRVYTHNPPGIAARVSPPKSSKQTYK